MFYGHFGGGHFTESHGNTLWKRTICEWQNTNLNENTQKLVNMATRGLRHTRLRPSLSGRTSAYMPLLSK